MVKSDTSLFKVEAVVEIMVVGKDNAEAISLASSHFAKEMEYVKYRSSIVSKHSDVPSDWLEMIPYSNIKIDKKCSLLIPTQPVENKPSSPTVITQEVVVPEPVKPQPVQPVKPTSTMPILNFNIPIRGVK